MPITAIDTYVVTSNGRPTILKDPDAVLDYTFDWSAYLLDIADTIVSATFIVEGGLVLVSSTNNTTSARAIISGGTLGVTERLTCRIVTAGLPSRTDDRSVFLKIRAR